MPRLRIVQPDTVDQHQHLSKIGAANGKVGLDAHFTASPHIHRGRQAQHVGHAVHGQLRNLLAGNDRQRTGDALERDRCGGRGDDHCLSDGVLGASGRSVGDEQNQGGKYQAEHPWDSTRLARPLVSARYTCSFPERRSGETGRRAGLKIR